jgi:hypothetical protein
MLIGCGGDDSPSLANCDSFCQVNVECADADRPTCISQCEEQADEIRAESENCFNLLSNQNACVGGLSCPAWQAWLNDTPPDSYPCRDEDVALETCLL